MGLSFEFLRGRAASEAGVIDGAPDGPGKSVGPDTPRAPATQPADQQVGLSGKASLAVFRSP